MAGETNLMGAGELSSVDKLRRLFEAFNEKRDILNLLDHSLRADGVQIFIGQESGFRILDDVSMVTAPYSADNEVVGVIGVIGPTRMAYERVFPSSMSRPRFSARRSPEDESRTRGRIAVAAVVQHLPRLPRPTPQRRRLAQDFSAGRPLVAHVIVALADNEYQGIVRVPQSLGDGDRPQSNLYWGAMYGVQRLPATQRRLARGAAAGIRRSAILERVLFRRDLVRDGKSVDRLSIGRSLAGQADRRCRSASFSR